MLTEFEQLKEDLKPLFKKAFYEQFNSHDQSIKKETNALFQAASNEEQLKNVLKVLDYYARGEDEIYDKTNADAIYSKLFSKAQSNNDWRISGTYSDTNAANEAADIKSHLIKPPPAPVSAIPPAPAVQYAGPLIRAPRLPTNSANVTPNNNQSLEFAPPRENVNPLVPKGAAGSSNPASKHSTPNRSAPRQPTNAAEEYRAAILKQANLKEYRSDNASNSVPKGAAGYKAGR